MMVRLLTLLRALLKATGLLPLVKRVLYRERAAQDGGRAARPGSGWRYRLKLLVEQANFAANENVHDLPPICRYWQDRHLAALLRPFGFGDPTEFFALEVGARLRATPGGRRRVVSIGSGNCDFEVALAARFAAQGLRGFTIECMDINESMLARDAALALARGVQEYVRPLRADFNAWVPEEGAYCAAIANMSLHHVVNLEGLFDAVAKCLAPGGIFAVHDMIGRNGHMRWPEALEVVERFWSELPPSYRRNGMLGSTDEHYVNFDCSRAGFEGIRAQDILPLLVRRFHFRTFVPYANAIEAFVDRSIGPNFDPARPWDRDFIDRVHAADQAAFLAGRLKPTQCFAVLALEDGPCRHPESLSPQFCVRQP